MLAPPPGGTAYDAILPGTPNPNLAAAANGWAQINELINGGLWSGWNDLEQLITNGNAGFFPGATI